MMDIQPKNLKAQARRLLQGRYSFFAMLLLVILLYTLLSDYIVTSLFPSINGIFSLILYYACSMVLNIVNTLLWASLYRILIITVQKRTAGFADLFFSFNNRPEQLAIYSVIAFLVSNLYSFLSSLYVSFVGDSRIVMAVIFFLSLILMIWFTATYSATLFLYGLDSWKSARDMMEESRRMMKGYRLRYLWLYLTFLGVMLLGVLSFGIGLLFVIPYFHATAVFFFFRIHARKNGADQ